MIYDNKTKNIFKTNYFMNQIVKQQQKKKLE